MRYVLQELPILHFDRDPSAINKGIARVEGAIKKYNSFARLMAGIGQNIERQKTNIQIGMSSLPHLYLLTIVQSTLDSFVLNNGRSNRQKQSW